MSKSEVYKQITDNLLELGCIEEKEQQVFLFTQKQIRVDEDVLDCLVQKIRAEFLEDGKLSDEITFLTFMLNLNNILKNFFSKYENQQLKKRLTEIKDEPIGKMAKYVIDSMTSAIVASI